MPSLVLGGQLAIDLQIDELANHVSCLLILPVSVFAEAGFSFLGLKHDNAPLAILDTTSPLICC